MDFEWEVIQKQILPGTTCGDGVGLEEKCPINLVGELQADRANIDPNVDQSAAVHMKTKKRNIAKVRNALVDKPG